LQRQKTDFEQTSTELDIIEKVNDVSLAFSSALGLDFQSGQIYMALLRLGPLNRLLLNLTLLKKSMMLV